MSDIDLKFSQKQWLAHFNEIKRKGSLKLQAEQIDGTGHMLTIDVRSSYMTLEHDEYIYRKGAAEKLGLKRTKLEVRMKKLIITRPT